MPIGYHEGREAVWGFLGTSAEARQVKGDQQIFYVNNGHANAADTNDGLDPDEPLATIQAIIDRTVAYNAGTGTRRPELQQHDVIYVADDVSEAVIVPGANVPTYVSIVGAGHGRHSPTWGSGAAASNCLTVRREGWRISGFTFECPSAAAGIQLQESVANTYDAYKTIIDNCVFDGLWSGLYGIELHGAPHRIGIYNNWFVEMNNANPALAFCIYVTDSTDSNPYQCEIIGNRFMDSDNYVGSLASARAFNVSLFKDNVFEDGVLLTPVIFLDLRGGSRGYNIVTGNYFGGAYTNAGGYYANAATPNFCWIGNVAEPTPATVADNGYTIAVPA
jgi:hypothetical protein